MAAFEAGCGWSLCQGGNKSKTLEGCVCAESTSFARGSIWQQPQAEKLTAQSAHQDRRVPKVLAPLCMKSPQLRESWNLCDRDEQVHSTSMPTLYLAVGTTKAH